jgi:hypothetical protein
MPINCFDFYISVISITIKFKIKNVEWDDELLDTGSQKFIEMKNKVTKLVSRFQIISFYPFEWPENSFQGKV